MRLSLFIAVYVMCACVCVWVCVGILYASIHTYLLHALCIWCTCAKFPHPIECRWKRLWQRLYYYFSFFVLFFFVPSRRQNKTTIWKKGRQTRKTEWKRRSRSLATHKVCCAAYAESLFRQARALSLAHALCFLFSCLPLNTLALCPCLCPTLLLLLHYFHFQLFILLLD